MTQSTPRSFRIFFSKSPQVTYSGYTHNNNDALSIITNTYYVTTIEAYTEEALLFYSDIFSSRWLDGRCVALFNACTAVFIERARRSRRPGCDAYANYTCAPLKVSSEGERNKVQPAGFIRVQQFRKQED